MSSKYFLEKIDDDKTPFMLLTDFIYLNMGMKEKFKEINQWFTTILSKLPIDISLDDSIIFYYYTKVVPHDIAMFMNTEENITLVEKFAKVVVV